MGRRGRKGRNVRGVLLLDKPKGDTSNGALQRVKRIYNAQKAGHTGSLDPIATGLLPLCFGETTKISGMFLEADKRAIGNAIEITFKDGSSIKESVDYPVGHRRRRSEGIPLLKEKFERYLRGRLSQKNADAVLEICASQAAFEQTRVNDMMDLFVV